jgi:23S rRNA (uridine2552-2'-O)-methyltransferase
MPRRWLEEHRRDYYYRLAKKEGYRSRAAFKLLQASRKYNLIKRGDAVVDLGAAPGGWIQVARTLVGDKGYVLGIDLNPIKRFDWPNVDIIVADITDSKTLDSIKERLSRKADAVVSDASQNVSGIWELDHARQIDLARASLRIATSSLRIGGTFLTKAFQGSLLNDFVKEVKGHFKFVRIFKPKASRPSSSEVYIVAISKKKSPSSDSKVNSFSSQ